MTSHDLLHTLRRERDAWDALLASVPGAWRTRAGAEGEWSVKDVIAHVTWYEREMVGLLQTRALVGSGLWGLPHAERNAAIFAQNRNRTLDDVLTEAQQVFARFASALETLSDADLNDPSHFAEMPADWVPWKVIADNSYEHYQAHAPLIRAWLEKLNS